MTYTISQSTKKGRRVRLHPSVTLRTFLQDCDVEMRSNEGHCNSARNVDLPIKVYRLAKWHGVATKVNDTSFDCSYVVHHQDFHAPPDLKDLFRLGFWSF